MRCNHQQDIRYERINIYKIVCNETVFKIIRAIYVANFKYSDIAICIFKKKHLTQFAIL